MLVMPDYIWGSITSIGRVITPIYPLFIFLLMERDTKWSRTLAVIILLIGIGAAIGLATSIHPYHLVGDPVPLGDEYPF
jgi:RsiW-degrading membrane proteinase PrsW (M82 family)